MQLQKAVQPGSPPPPVEPVEYRPGWAQDDLSAEPIDVSVCIVNWNCREHLRACLTSLQDVPQGVRLETIVVDNASTDGAVEMVRREFPEVVVILNSDNVGFARANNQAAAVAHGRYLFFLNNDTVVPAFSLRKLIDYANDHPDVGMIGPGLLDADGQWQISYRRRPTLMAVLHRTSLLGWTGLFKAAYRDYRRETYQPEQPRGVEVLLGAAILMRRQLFDRCGRWDEDFRFGVEDVELSDRVGKTHRLIYLPSVRIVHHGRLSSRANVAFTLPNLLIGHVQYFRKTGASRAAVFAYKLLITLDAPVQMLGKMLEAGRRAITGPRKKAAKSWQSALGLWHFLKRELRRFWRA